MATPLSILVVEDHDLLREAMLGMLRDNGYAAAGVYCAEDVAAAAALHRPDLYVVDLNLPGEDGISLAARLRSSQPDAGIVMVSARSDLVDRLTGYKTGADVYLTKPFEIEELLAVIESLGTRLKKDQPLAGCVLQPARLAMKGPTGEVLLTHSEIDLLRAFIEAPDGILAHDQVALHLKLGPDASSRPTANVRLSQLRRKLAGSGAEEPIIRAIRSTGYKLCVPMTIA